MYEIYEIYGIDKSIEKELKLVMFQGPGAGENGKKLLNELEILLGSNGNALELHGGGSCTIL